MQCLRFQPEHFFVFFVVEFGRLHTMDGWHRETEHRRSPRLSEAPHNDRDDDDDDEARAINTQAQSRGHDDDNRRPVMLEARWLAKLPHQLRRGVEAWQAVAGRSDNSMVIMRRRCLCLASRDTGQEVIGC